MSINSLANAAVARRTDSTPLRKTPEGLGQIAFASLSPVPPQSSDTQQSAKSADTTLHVLFGYIPVEILTLYIASLAALNGVAAKQLAFWLFLGAAPIVVWLAYAAKVRELGGDLPIRFKYWPLWEMFAAGLAYLAWSTGLPEFPYAGAAWHSPQFSGLAVLACSTILGLAAPVFQRKLG